MRDLKSDLDEANKKIAIRVLVEESDVEEADAAASRMCLTRSDIVRFGIRMFLEQGIVLTPRASQCGAKTAT